MRISTRIQLSALLAVAIAVATALVLLFGLRTVESAIERNDRVAASLNHIFELSMLTTDYLVHYEPRAERQWRAKHEELGLVLDQLSATSVRGQLALDRVRVNEQEAASLFDEITAAYEEGQSGAVDPGISREYQARLAARLLVVMQAMVSDSVTLGELSSEEALVTQQRTSILVMAIAAVGVSVMVVIGLSTNRTVVRPVIMLRDVALEVGQGNLKAQSGVTSTDEVGELAAAFDAMVSDLRRSYLRLEQEVADRRRAEQELSEYRDHLEQLVEARTAELVAGNEDLRQATRAKDDFMASMSHELRTPLNSIIGFTDMMLRGLAGETTPEQERQLSMVLQSGQQLLALINDVLDLSRLDAGHVRVLPTAFSVTSAVGNLVDMMTPVAAGQHLKLTWRAEDGVTDTITTDRGKFDQIMLNLLSNAIKFTDAGSVEVVVRKDVEGMVSLEVHDTGIGIPAGELDAIFEYFHQAGPYSTKSHPGTGLGLPISRRLADAIGGRIDVTSTVGEGSTFVLTVPVEVPPLPPVEVSPPESAV